MPLAEPPNGPALAVNQGRNRETRSTTDAAPEIRSAWDNRAASKLNPCTAAPDPGLAAACDGPAGVGGPAGLGGPALAGAPLPVGAPHRGQLADPSAT